MNSKSRWRPDLPADDDADEDLGPSKTELKQTMHELQDLGVALVELPPRLLDALDMEDRLREALRELMRLKSREAIRRQSQFIGKMLRETDPEPFRRALASYRLGQSRALQDAEKWRTRLLADDAALTDWVQAHPDVDPQPLRALIRNVRREQAQASAAAEDGANVAGKLYRELFRRLRMTLQDAVDNPAM